MPRSFKWFSSVDPANLSILEDLQLEMSILYESTVFREGYGHLIGIPDKEVDMDPVTKAFQQWMALKPAKTILEYGCGLGRVWNHLKATLTAAEFTGIEVDSYSIKHNSKLYPRNNWIQGSIYQEQLVPDQYFDVVYSFYVLEHLVFPRRALDIMYRKVKPGGSLALVFPDFTSTCRLPSQTLGFGPERTASEKLKKGKVVDAIVSLFDSRIRLPYALKQIKAQPGKFFINTRPICLDTSDATIMWPDFDAIYIAHKEDVLHWAAAQDAVVQFPAGAKPPFDEHVFMCIEKSIT